jgi:hypothetical protein
LERDLERKIGTLAESAASGPAELPRPAQRLASGPLRRCVALIRLLGVVWRRCVQRSASGGIGCGIAAFVFRRLGDQSRGQCENQISKIIFQKFSNYFFQKMPRFPGFPRATIEISRFVR